MALLDVKDYIQIKERALADYEDRAGLGQEDAGEYRQSGVFLLGPLRGGV